MQRNHANRPEASLQGAGREYKKNRDAPGKCIPILFADGMERLGTALQ